MTVMVPKEAGAKCTSDRCVSCHLTWLADRTVCVRSDNYCELYCQWWRKWECNILWYVGGTDNEYQWNLKLSGGKCDGSRGRGLLQRSKGLKQVLIDAVLRLSGLPDNRRWVYDSWLRGCVIKSYRMYKKVWTVAASTVIQQILCFIGC